MSDFLYVVLLLSCCAATAGLGVLCDRLMPRQTSASGLSGAAGTDRSSQGGER